MPGQPVISGITPLINQAQHLVLISSRNSDLPTIYGPRLLTWVIPKNRRSSFRSWPFAFHCQALSHRVNLHMHTSPATAKSADSVSHFKPVVTRPPQWRGRHLAAQRDDVLHRQKETFTPHEHTR